MNIRWERAEGSRVENEQPSVKQTLFTAFDKAGFSEKL
jgi:hypothetical protein